MFYMKANRNYNGKLHFETLAGINNDKSLYHSESEFIREAGNISAGDDCIYGIVCIDMHSILSVY